MKPLSFFVLFLSVILFTTCSKNSETRGEVKIYIDNQSLYNQENYFVSVGIALNESDQELLIDLGNHDVSKGGMVEFDAVELNIGNYYLRYVFYLGNSASGDITNKPFQIQAEEETFLEIIH